MINYAHLPALDPVSKCTTCITWRMIYHHKVSHGAFIHHKVWLTGNAAHAKHLLKCLVHTIISQKTGVNLKCSLKKVDGQLVLFTYAYSNSGMPLLSHTCDAITANGICQYLLVPPLEHCCFFGASCLTQPHVLQLCNNFIIKWWWAYFQGWAYFGGRGD